MARLEQLGATGTELGLLKEAQEKSNGLIATETRAMRLVLDAAGAAPADMPGPVAGFELSAADRGACRRREAGEGARDPLAVAFNDQFRANQAQLRRNRELMDGMTSLIGEVTEAAGTVASSSQQMASTSSETGKAVDEIASAIGEMAQGAERQVRMAESAR